MRKSGIKEAKEAVIAGEELIVNYVIVGDEDIL